LQYQTQAPAQVKQVLVGLTKPVYSRPNSI
jgi:hypothetical protein